MKVGSGNVDGTRTLLAVSCDASQASRSFRSFIGLLAIVARDEHGIHAAETEGVGHHGTKSNSPRFVRYVVEITHWVAMLEVRRRRYDTVLQRHKADEHFNRSGGTHEM